MKDTEQVMRWGMSFWEEAWGFMAFWVPLSTMLSIQKIHEASPFRFYGHMSAMLLAFGGHLDLGHLYPLWRFGLTKAECDPLVT